MKTVNAIKKLEKVSDSIRREHNQVIALIKNSRFGTSEISFFDQNGDAICISSKDTKLKNDSINEIFYDTFHDSISIAIKFIM